MKINKTKKNTKILEARQLVHLNLKWELLDKIELVMQEQKFRDRTECVEYLIDMAIRIIQKIESTPPEELAKELVEAHEQLKHGGLVDYAGKLSGRDLKLLYNIIQDEYNARGMNGKK
jgi:hypothetical protein